MPKGDTLGIALLAAAGIGAYFLLRNGAQAAPVYRSGPVVGTGAGLLDTLAAALTSSEPAYKSPDEWRAELMPLIRAQEHAYAMPDRLLEAVLENESSFRHDIITGATKGSAGEEGIAQLKPEYHLSSFAERTNPRIAIPYAAKYLAKNYLRFNSWREAVIAYNCGPTDWENYGAAKCGPALQYVAKVERRIGALA